VNGKVIQFVPRGRLDHRSHVSSYPFRSLPRPEDLAMDHADTAPCEYVPLVEECHADMQTDREA
jgi:hypothetical protein